MFSSPKARQYLGYILLLAALAALAPWAYTQLHREQILWRNAQQAFDQGDYSQAATYYLRAWEEGKKSPRILDRLGDAYLAAHRLQKARETFSELTRHYPGEPYAWFKLAQILWWEGSHESALKKADKALEKKPDWRNALFLRARILTSQGELREAIDIYYRILGEKP